jgi:hypothetical protein
MNSLTLFDCSSLALSASPIICVCTGPVAGNNSL